MDLSWFFVVIDGLKEKYTEAMKRSDVKAIVLTGETFHSRFFSLSFVILIFFFNINKLNSFL